MMGWEWIRTERRRRIQPPQEDEIAAARAISVDRFIGMPEGTSMTLSWQTLAGHPHDDLAVLPAYYRVRALHVDTAWPIAQSGDEYEVENVPAPGYRRRHAPRVLGYARTPMMPLPAPTGRRFEPWRCTCVCPAEWVWDPDRHDPTCGAFVPDTHHTEEGGSG